MSTVAQINLSLRGAILSVDAQRSVRLHLAPGEVCRLARGLRSVRVLFGTGWIAYSGHDLLLRAGERASFATRRGDLALLSGVGVEPLLVELGA
jgi:hypothetical protein